MGDIQCAIKGSWTIKKLCQVTALLRPWVCKDEYSIKEVYESNLGNNPKVQGGIWTRFICWLAAHQGLKTMDKLKHIGGGW